MRAARFLQIPLVLLTLGALASCDTSHPGGGLIWTVASPDPAVVNITPATFAQGSGVTDEVLAECGLDRKIPEELVHHTPVPVVLAETPAGGARVLDISVTNIIAPPGGAWSGPKSMTLHGELVQGGVVVASFDARRTTTRGHQTCEMLGIILDALAGDIRPWLASPTLNARLGEA
jgi:hypothetical protein